MVLSIPNSIEGSARSPNNPQKNRATPRSRPETYETYEGGPSCRPSAPQYPEKPKATQEGDSRFGNDRHIEHDIAATVRE